MSTRAQRLLDQSRGLIDRSRVAAAQFLTSPAAARPPETVPPLEIPPRSAEPDDEPSDALATICAGIALRDLNLVDALLSQLEQMESEEDDQDRLAELYRLDHLATRLRRNAENLRVLTDRESGDTTSATASMVDVIRAAMSAIDQFSRITIGRVVPLGVVGVAAEDLSRLLAEVLDNATTQSPPDSPVRVSAHLTEQGSVLLRIEDEGIGLQPERLDEINSRLAAEPVLDRDAVRHMGLAVVRRLAARHDIRVRLDHRAPHGTTATILLPAALVCELPEATWSGSQTVAFPPTTPTPSPSTTAGLPRPSRVGGTTATGLPRRVSHSIKTLGERQPHQKPPEQADHDRLVADLGAFVDGERAAKDDLRGSINGKVEGPEQ